MCISEWIMWIISKSHHDFYIYIYLKSIHQVDMKNVVKCYKQFFCYFNTLKTHCVMPKCFFIQRTFTLLSEISVVHIIPLVLIDKKSISGWSMLNKKRRYLSTPLLTSLFHNITQQLSGGPWLKSQLMTSG